MKTLKFGLFLIIGLFLISLTSCKKDPSIVKIYVRTDSNAKVEGAQVVLISDLNVNDYKTEDVDTAYTNTDGFAEFVKDEFFKSAGKDNDVAYFDIVVKSGEKSSLGRIRSRAHITSVETIYLPK